MKKKNLHKIAPTLSDIPLKKGEFNLPDQYFESIEDIIIAKLKAAALENNKSRSIPSAYFDTVEDAVLNKLTKKKVIFSIKNITKYVVPITIAASLLLFIILNNTDNTVTFDSISTLDIENSIENGFINIDAENLATIFPDIDFNEDDFHASFTDDEVLEYLNSEDLDEIIYDN